MESNAGKYRADCESFFSFHIESSKVRSLLEEPYIQISNYKLSMFQLLNGENKRWKKWKNFPCKSGKNKRNVPA